MVRENNFDFYLPGIDNYLYDAFYLGISAFKRRNF